MASSPIGADPMAENTGLVGGEQRVREDLVEGKTSSTTNHVGMHMRMRVHYCALLHGVRGQSERCFQVFMARFSIAGNEELVQRHW